VLVDPGDCLTHLSQPEPGQEAGDELVLGQSAPPAPREAAVALAQHFRRQRQQPLQHLQNAHYHKFLRNNLLLIKKKNRNENSHLHRNSDFCFWELGRIYFWEELTFGNLASKISNYSVLKKSK